MDNRASARRRNGLWTAVVVLAFAATGFAGPAAAHDGKILHHAVEKPGETGAKVHKVVVFGDYDLERPEVFSGAEREAIDAVVSICCVKTMCSSGFVVDIGHLGAPADRDYDIIATVSHAFYDKEGVAYGNCTVGEGTFDQSSERRPFDFRKGWHGAPVRQSGKQKDNDVSLVVVPHRLSSELGALKLGSYDENTMADQPLLMAGVDFANSRRRGLAMATSKCRSHPKTGEILQKSFEPNVLVNNCDWVGGFSGGPLVLKERSQQQDVTAIAVAAGHVLEDYDKYDFNIQFDNRNYNVGLGFTSEMEKELSRLVEEQRQRMADGGFLPAPDLSTTPTCDYLKRKNQARHEPGMSDDGCLEVLRELDAIPGR